jgi:thioredoxin 1
MDVTEVKSYSELKEILSNKEKVIIMCSAPWCGPCRLIKPTYQTCASENPEITFLYIDTSTFSDPDQKFIATITAIPTFFSFYDEGPVNTFTGANKEKLSTLIEQLNDK